MTAVIVFISCKKTSPTTPTPTPAGDITPPVITLKGKINDTISLSTTAYFDPGYTATDDVDGDLSAFVIVSGSVSTGTVGSYIKEYNVRDGAGNIAPKKTRNVVVKNDAGYLDGNYTAVCGCTIAVGDTPPPTPTITNTSYTLSVASSSNGNNSITLSKYPIRQGSVFSFPTHAISVNGKGMTLLNMSPGVGSGTISVTNNSFTITSTQYDNDYPSRVTECKVIHTKN